MMVHDNGTPLTPEYRHSWALVIGINDYKYLPPLEYAVGDARAVAAALTERFNFPAQRIIQLTNEDATREAILSAFDETFTDKNKVDRDDRLLVFFAGHGLTRHGNQGDQGYIAPVDAKQKAWRSLIAMSDLTDLADFVLAKHIFFIMDACYSGLALARGGALDTQVQRMLTRQSWQVLTAGKADEEVADGGGPTGENSIFTGYLLEALAGAAVGRDGLLTASYVMGYVYRRLINDPRSKQTPHFGWLRGDGDFVFQKPVRPVLPTPIGIALEHGDPGARIRAVHALSRLSKIDDGPLAHLALDRLEAVARQDSTSVVRHQAARLLGWMPLVDETRPGGSTLVRLALERDSRRQQRARGNLGRRIRRASIAALLLGLVGLGLLGGLSGRGAASQREEMAHLQTLAAQDGEMVATLLATSTTFASETSAASPVPSREAAPSEATPMLGLTATETTSATPASPGLDGVLVESSGDAVAGSSIVFTDDFSDTGGRWEVGNTGGVSRAIEDGQLHFYVGTDYALWASRPVLASQDDLIFSVDVTVVEGQGDFSYGLIFRQVDFDNYYYFLLSNQGHVLAIKQVDGVGSFLLEPTTLSVEVLPPGRSSVRLTVLAIGPVFTFFVDGQEVGGARDAAIGSGTLGVAVQTLGDVPVHVAFDNVVVQEP